MAMPCLHLLYEILMHISFVTGQLTFSFPFKANHICDRPRENRPSSHLGMIVEIPVLKVVISIASFCSC